MHHVDNWDTLAGIHPSDGQKEEKDVGENEDEQKEDQQQSNEGEEEEVLELERSGAIF